jgi:hypothetical protein
MLLSGEEQEIKRMIGEDKQREKLHQALLTESDNMLDLELLERKQIGRRLLSVSREALRRIFYLSYAYRMTDEPKYAQRAKSEMLNVAGFSDWNPSHFLDVAEMTMAVAIGYDWLFDTLTEEEKEILENAIVKLGIEPSYNEEYNRFLTATHNWNQVCNAGMVFGALAIYEDQPELAQKTIQRAVETISLAMEDYKPDGAYPEGYGYWNYGTTFNVLLLNALEKVYSTDFGLGETEGFLETAGFFEHMTGTTGRPYNWGDAGSGEGNLSPAMFWFAQKKDNPSLLWVEKDYLEKQDLEDLTRNRVLPAAMIWGRDLALDQVPMPEEKTWVGQGPNPVALMRSSWTDPEGIYVGFKAGSASVNHGHMDIGSFIMEAEGVRWALDFGSQNYESLESKGIQVFGRTQDAERWSIFRMNNYAHSTLTIDDELQRVEGHAKIDRHSESDSFSFAISDISEAYVGQVQGISRGVGIVEKAYVVVRDEVKNNGSASRIQWNMVTPADVEIKGQEVVLTKEGKKLHLRVQGLENVSWKTYSTDPQTDYDAPNPGTIRIGFEYELGPDAEAQYQVLLIPEKALSAVKGMERKLANW